MPSLWLASASMTTPPRAHRPRSCAAAAASGLAWNACSGRGFALAGNAFVREGRRGDRRPRRPRRGSTRARSSSTRGPVDFYEMSHIPGALPLPEDDFDARSRSSSRGCARASTSSSTAAATAARRATSWRASCASAGIQAAILHEGWPAWTDAGYPAKEGAAAVRLAAAPAPALGAGARRSAASSSTRAYDKIAHPARVRADRLPLPGDRAQRARSASCPPTSLAVALPWLEVVGGRAADHRRLAARGGRGRAAPARGVPGRGRRRRSPAASTSRTAAASRSTRRGPRRGLEADRGRPRAAGGGALRRPRPAAERLPSRPPPAAV